MAKRLITQYLSNQAFYRLKIDPNNRMDNPDQRITDDVRSYTASSVMLAVGIVRQAFYCIAFTGVLLSLAPNLVVFLLIYCFIGSWVTVSGFGPRLTALAFGILQKEADLRFDLVRVGENAESVAFYDAGSRESKVAIRRLDTAVEISRKQAKLEAYLALWQNIYAYATILMPSLLMAPKFFADEVRFGTITQVSIAFNRIESALSYVISNLVSLSSLAAETERLDDLLSALSHNSAPASTSLPIIASKKRKDAELVDMMNRVRRVLSNSTTGLDIQGLTLTTPHRERLLCENLSFALSPGQSLLIVGPSGAGKSSILRAIAGLWSAGHGTIHAPAHEDIFFLPQSPYMPLGTLRQQLCFPDDPLKRIDGENTGVHVPAAVDNDNSKNNNSSGNIDSAVRGMHGPVVDSNDSNEEDATLRSLLDVVRLPYLLKRVGGLDVERDWAHMLSLGEQQRVAFLRLLRRSPVVAFLDEATSGVDGPTELALYTALRARCACYVSIGHRKELLEHHSHVLECVGNNRWEMQSVEEYLKKSAIGMAKR